MSSDAPKLSSRSQRRCVTFQDENALIQPGKNSYVKSAHRKAKKLNALSDRTNSPSVSCTLNISADQIVKKMPLKRKATVQGDENKGPLLDEIIPPKRVLNTRRALAESNNTLVNKEGSSSAETVTVLKLQTISSETKQDIQVSVSGVTKSQQPKEALLDVLPRPKPLARSLRSAKSDDSKENVDQREACAPTDNHLGRRGQGTASEKEVDSPPRTRGKEKAQSQPVSVLDKADGGVGPKTRRGKKVGEVKEERGKVITTPDFKEPVVSTEKTDQEEGKVKTRSALNARGKSEVSPPEENRSGRRGQDRTSKKEVDRCPSTRGKEKTLSQPVSVLDKVEETVGPKTRRGKKGGKEREEKGKAPGFKEPIRSSKKTDHEVDKAETQSVQITRGKKEMSLQMHDSLQESSAVPEKAPVRRSARSKTESAVEGKTVAKNPALGKKHESDILSREGKTNKESGTEKVALMKVSHIETPEESVNSVCSRMDASTSKPDEINPSQRPRRTCRNVAEKQHSTDLLTSSSTLKSSTTVAKDIPEENTRAPLSPAVFFGTAKSKVTLEKSKSRIESVPAEQFFGKKSTQNKVTVKCKNKALNEVPSSEKEKGAEIQGPVYKNAQRSDLVDDGDDLYEFAFDENEEEPVKKRRRKKPVKKKAIQSLNPFVKPILPVKSTKRPLIDNSSKKQDQPKKVCSVAPEPPLTAQLADKRPGVEIQTVSVQEAVNSLVRHSPAVKRDESKSTNKSDNNITHLRAQGASPQVSQSPSCHHVVESHSITQNCGSPVVAGSSRLVESSRLTISSAVMLPTQCSTPKRQSFAPAASVSLTPATAAPPIHSPSRSPSPAQSQPCLQDSEENLPAWGNSLDRSDLFDDIPATKFSLPARMFEKRRGMTCTPRRDAFVTTRKIPHFSPETTSNNAKPSAVKFSVVPELCLNTSAKTTLAPALPATFQKPVVEPAIDNCFGFDDEAEAEVRVEPAASGPARMCFKPSRPIVRGPLTPKPSLKEVQAMLLGKKASAAPATPCSSRSSSTHPKSSTNTPTSVSPLPSASKSESEATPVSTPVTESPIPLFDDLFGDSAQSPFLRPPRRSYERQNTVKRIVYGDIVCSDDEGEEVKDSLHAVSEKTTNETTKTKSKKEKPMSIYRKKKKLVQTKLVDQWADQLTTHFEEIDDVELFVQ